MPGIKHFISTLAAVIGLAIISAQALADDQTAPAENPSTEAPATAPDTDNPPTEAPATAPDSGNPPAAAPATAPDTDNTPAAPAPTPDTDDTSTVPEEAAPEEAAPVPTPPLYSLGGFNLTGHLDAGYSYLSGSGKFNSHDDVNTESAADYDRVFDFKHDAAVFHALDLQMARTPESGFGGLVDMTIGEDADTIASYGTINKNKGPDVETNHYFDLTQLYAYYATGPLSIIAGKFVTLAGAEVIKSDADSNFSRSILFGYAIPFTHTGLRATYKVGDMWSLIAGVNEGWDQVEDTNDGKTLELGTTIAPTKTILLAASLYSGKENVTIYPKVSQLQGTRNLVDVVGTYNITDKLSFVLNFDYGSQQDAAADRGTAKWDGVAAYVNFQFNNMWRMTLRGEFFDDQSGYRTGLRQDWVEGTETIAFMPTRALEFRAEVRVDKSDKDAFLEANNVTPITHQESVGLEALYKF